MVRTTLVHNEGVRPHGPQQRSAIMTTSAVDETRTDDDSTPERTPDGRIGAGRAFSWLLLICGVLGSVASFVITDDKFKLLEDPSYVPGCSLNPIISCGNIMKSDQSHAFGFPNPMIGMMAYPIMVCVAMGLLAGARYRPWYWLGFESERRNALWTSKPSWTSFDPPNRWLRVARMRP